MENNAPNKATTRGARKTSTTLMVWGDQQAIIYPRYLHVSHGIIRGLVLEPHSEPSLFEAELGAFLQEPMRIIKD
jgi:hypothetical protein